MAIYKNTPPIVTNGLVLYLDAANPQSYTSGSTTWNSLGNSTLSGSLLNGPTYSTSGGGSILLDGTNDNILISTIPTSSFSLISSSFTVDMWVRVNSNNAGFVSSNQSPTNGGQYSFVNRQGQLVVSFYGTPTFTDIYAGNILTGSWINIVHTHNFTNQTSSIYQQGIRTGVGSMAPSPLITSASLYLGWFGFGGSYLSGSIASTKIYNRALSQAEVTQNYNATKARFGL